MKLENPTMSRATTLAWLAIFLAVLVWSVIAPVDYMTWLLEVFPALAGIMVLAWTWQRFPLTPLVYWFILVHSIILMVGGHYTYAQVPLFDWIEQVFNQSRNNYDKLGHLAQGWVPALIAREILIRRRIVNGVWWTNFIVVCICLAISATYELVEWLVAVLSKQAAESFLGTQGYLWDTQSDMAWALLGSIASIAVLGRIHNRQIAAVQARVGSSAG